jgi:tripartite-type tricarboxylate transporter receptor subunit TctC
MTTTLPSRRSILQLACTATATLCGATMTKNVLAQSAPPSAINQLRILCSGPAGSIPDIVARRVAEQLSRQYPQGAIVDNRPGAAGQIAVNALKAAIPDGSTVLLAQGAIATVYPYLYTKLAYDPIADLQPISMAGEMTLALSVGPAVPNTVTNVEEFVDWMRANPKLANVASPGTGTLPHLLEVMLFREANVPWQHVVYAGGPPAMIDLLGGQVAAFVEQRYRNLIVREWFAFFMPARVPTSTITAVSQTLQTALVRPDLNAAFADSGMLAVASTPVVLANRIAQEQRYWQPILLATGIKAE